METDEYVVATDTGDKGKGATVHSALKDLKNTTPAIIYLDTADYLLISEQALSAVDDLRNVLRKNVEIYQFLGEAELPEVSKFLRVHGNGPNLKQYEKGSDLPILDCREERIKILRHFSKKVLDN